MSKFTIMKIKGLLFIGSIPRRIKRIFTKETPV